MHGKILVGTASWTDPGFVADWYPRTLPASQRLHWYAEHFSLVEVNSTFYRLPEARSIARWCDQTPHGFVFDLKLHRLLSRHSTKAELLPPDIRSKAPLRNEKVQLTPKIEQAVAERFLAAIEPLRECQKLGALLLQLSPAFSPRHNQLSELDHLFELLQGNRIAVELRNRGWVSPDALVETKKFFTRRKITFVMVDAPNYPHFMVMPNLDLVTTSRLAYLRAHGRNASGYVRGRTVPDRFDYDYSERELREIADRALKASEQAHQVHVVYNNNKGAYAPKAAATFQNILNHEHPETLPAEVRQKELVYA